jgi:hypothetical protein
LEATTRLLTSVTPTDRAAVERLLAEWWPGVLAHDSLGETWKTEQVDHLRTKCSSLPAESRKLALTTPAALARGVTEEDRGVGALLLGESAAAIVRGSATTTVALDRAVTFLSECWEAVEALCEALLRTPAWPTSLDTLAVTETTIDALLGHHFDRVPSDILIEEEDTARERGVSAYFWGYYPEVCLNATTLVRLTLLSRRDWVAIALQADALPLRGLRDDLWRHLHLHEDRDSILSLLGTAPPVFANNAWTGSTSGLAALHAANRHVDRIHDYLEQLTRAYAPPPGAQESLKAFEEDEVPEWLRQVSQIAIARSDGRLLLLLFGANLTREVLCPSWNGQLRWSAAQHALRAIYGVLDPKPSVAELQQVAALAGVPSNQTTIDCATYLVTSAIFDADAKDVWTWYRKLLQQSDNDLCSHARSWRRALCYQALAERLDKLSDPFDAWRDGWKALFVTDREHARFATLDQNALYPSLHLLRVGAELLRLAPSRSGSRQFFEELLAHTHRLLTNDARFISPLQPELAVDAIDVAPRVLGSDWPKSLEAHRPLLSVVKNRLYVAKLLLEGGAPFGEVETAVEVAGHGFADSVAEMKQSNAMDLNVHHLCELITVAAREHARTRTKEEP